MRKSDRHQLIQQLLEKDAPMSFVSLAQFQDVCFRYGISDTPGLRSLSYKLLLNYLSFDKPTWPSQLSKKRESYYDLMEDTVQKATTASPLSPSAPNPIKATLEQIDKDVRRTLPEFAFFQQWVSLSIDSPLSPCTLQPRNLYYTARSLFLLLKDMDSDFGARKHENSAFDYGIDYHWEVIERILFVYASLNPGVGYVQGMNEILGPLYYVLANDPDEGMRAHAEADAFWLFHQVMSEVREWFMCSMDRDASAGMGSIFRKLKEGLRKRDVELYEDLEAKDLQPAYYAFRWVSLLLAQEFPLPEVFRLWDSLFADRRRFSFLQNVCLSMLICARQQLLGFTFHENIALLQQYPIQDIQVILKKAYELYDEDSVDLHSNEVSPTDSMQPKSSTARLSSEAVGSHSRSLSAALLTAGSVGLQALVQRVSDLATSAAAKDDGDQGDVDVGKEAKVKSET